MIEVNQIYNCDCLDLMAQMPDGFAGLTITSPPYNLSRGQHHKIHEGKYEHYNDNMKIDDYLDWQSKVIAELIRVSKIVFYNTQMISGNKTAVLSLLGRFSSQIKEIIIWDKVRSEPAIQEGVLNSTFEFIIVMGEDPGRRKFQKYNFPRGTLDNIFRIERTHNWKDDIINSHGAVFPLRFPQKIIKNFSVPGDLIFDPFMGTGQTAIACIKSERNFIGSEISSEYVDLANKRIKPYNDQLKLEI